MKWLLLAQTLLAFVIVYVLFNTETTHLEASNTQAAVFSLKPKSEPPTPSLPQPPKHVDPPKQEEHNGPKEEPKPSHPANPAQPSHPTTPTQSPQTTESPQPNNDPKEEPVSPPLPGSNALYRAKNALIPEYFTPEKDRRSLMLCKLGVQKHCKSKYISDVISTFWMVCPIYTANVNQTKVLYEFHKNFRGYARSYGINFMTVEVVFPGQEFQLTEPNNEPDDLQYKDEWIFAMRENLVNVGAKHLPADWQYIGWIDQHVFWEDPYWFEKSIWLFEHYNVVHLMNRNDFLFMNNRTEWYMEGFGKLYNQLGMGFERVDPRQCGMTWGTRREIFEELGGLLDICIGTKCDLYQNYAYIGKRYTRQVVGQDYSSELIAWQDKAIKVYKGKLGYLDSKVFHIKHCLEGCQTSNYEIQVNALIQYGYSPKKDLVRDSEGRLSFKNNIPLAKKLWELYGGKPRRMRMV